MAETDSGQDVAAALYRRRMERGFTQYEAGRLLGVSQGTYSRWETGERMPPPDRAEAIAAFLVTGLEALHEALTAAVREVSADHVRLGTWAKTPHDYRYVVGRLVREVHALHARQAEAISQIDAIRQEVQSLVEWLAVRGLVPGEAKGPESGVDGDSQ